MLFPLSYGRVIVARLVMHESCIPKAIGSTLKSIGIPSVVEILPEKNGTGVH